MKFSIGQYVKCINTIDIGIHDSVNLIGALGKVEEILNDYNHVILYSVNFGLKYGTWYMIDINLEDASELNETSNNKSKTITLFDYQVDGAEEVFELLNIKIINHNWNEDSTLVTYELDLSEVK